MWYRYSPLFASLLLLISLVVFNAGCQANHGTPSSSESDTRALQVYVTQSAQHVREKAMSYGLDVKVLEAGSPSLRLVQALLNAPTDQFFAVINPFKNRYITGGAVSEKVDPTEIDALFRKLKQINNAGIEQADRLFPKNEGGAKLVVFSDFQCPYCKLMDNLVEEFKLAFDGKLEVEMIHFPLPNHKHAFTAAEASECARAQGKFDPYKNALFAQQEDISEYTFSRVARKLKLDEKKFSQCMKLHEQRKKVRQDQYFGEYLGLTGTPTLVLNGEMLFGLSPDEIQEKIEKTLEEGAQKSASKTHS